MTDATMTDLAVRGWSFAIAAGLGIVATWLWLRVAERFGMMAAPNPIVPQHRRPIAHMGGLAVAAATCGTLAIAWWWLGSATSAFASILPAGLAFLLLGAIDDAMRLSPGVKLAWQIGCALLAVACGLVYPFTSSTIVNAAVAVAAIVVMVNAVNLTDVCDGLVAGLAGISLVAWSIAESDPLLAAWSAAAAGACAGFLVFNAPPARVFLGDAGSHWLGFLLIALPLAAAPAQEPEQHATATVLRSAVFLFELVLLITARAWQGIPFWRGSPDHFSLRLQAAGLSRWATVVIAWIAGAAACTLAVLVD